MTASWNMENIRPDEVNIAAFTHVNSKSWTVIKKKDVFYVHAKADKCFSEAILQITLSQRENYIDRDVCVFICVCAYYSFLKI